MEQSIDFSDADLLRGLQQDRIPDTTIKQLYRSCFEMARVYIKQNGGNEQDTEDIFQEVILAFIESVQKGKFRGECSIKSFLYSITRHIWLNELKRRGRANRREETYESSKDLFVPELAFTQGDRELSARVMKIIEQLGDACQKILLAFYYEGLPMKDILSRLKYDNEQVLRNKKYKCMKQLKDTLAGQADLIQYLKSEGYNG